MKHQLVIYSTDLCRAMEFYWCLFGVEPVRLSDELIWFDVVDPSLFLTIKKSDHEQAFMKRNGVVWLETNGFAVTARDRLEAVGLLTYDDTSIGCFYPSNNRLWVKDPDGNRWNFFIPELPASEVFGQQAVQELERPINIVICFADRGYCLPHRGVLGEGPCEVMDEGIEDPS